MRIIQNITHDVDGVKTSIYVVFESSQENCDLRQAIHDAASDYFLATYKKGDTVQGMSYADFALTVPNEYCAKYGFTKSLLQDTAETIDGNLILVSRYDFNRQLKDIEAVKQQRKALHKAYSVFGRRLEPVMRRSTAMADWTFFQITKQMLLWAEEFADSNESKNPYGYQERCFADAKLEEMKRTDKMEPPEEEVEQNQ